MARETAVLQRQSDDVGRLLRRIRSVDGVEGVSCSPRNDCSCGRSASGSGFSIPIQHIRVVRHAMAELYERRYEQRESLWERRLLVSEIAREVYGAHRVPGVRQVGGEHVHRLSEMARAPYSGCLLRCDGAES